MILYCSFFLSCLLMSILARNWPLLSILAGTCIVYTESHYCTPVKKPLQPRIKPTIILPLPHKTYSRSLFAPLLLPVTSLECNTNDDNIQDHDEGIIEKSKANFLELQDQFVRTILSKVPLVENFQGLSAAELRDTLANLWDTMTLKDIMDSVKDIKDTVANPELNKDAVVR